MAKIVKGARFISKISNSSGVPPTIPANEDHTTGWKDTDIYVGEWFFNTADSMIYFRSQDGMHQVVTVPSTGTTSGKINASYLPGNYMGALLYMGLWDASKHYRDVNGEHFFPGDDLGITPKNGDYYYVSVSGHTDLNTIDEKIDYNVGDFVIYSNVGTGAGRGWQKVDNSEPTIYATSVVYSNTGLTQLTNTFVSNALDKIIIDKFLVPYFNKTVNFNYDTTGSTNQLVKLNGNNLSGLTLLEINGNDTNKWVGFDGTTLNVGSYQDNSIVQFGPKGLINLSLTSTANFTYTDTGLTHYNRWSIYSSSSDGYIKGYANNGITSNLLISSVGNSYFNAGGLSVGSTTLISGTTLQVNSSNTISKLVISRGGSNIGTNDVSGILSFYQSYNSTPTEYGNINLRTTLDSSVNTTMGFKILNGNNSTLTEIMTLVGKYVGNPKVGINNTNPSYELDVVGSTSISNSLYVNTDISITGNTLYVGTNGSINFLGNNNTTLSFQDKMKIKWLSTNDLVFEGNSGSPWLTLNSITGLLTLGGYIHTESGDTKLFRMDQDVRTVSNVVFNRVNLNEKITYYDTGVTISDPKDVPNRKYVDDQINSHANYGIWHTGVTNTLTQTDVVLSNSGMTYFAGINTNNPTYNLEVVGNSLITDSLSINNELHVSGDVYISSGISNKDLSVGGDLYLSNYTTVYTSGSTLSSIEFGDSDDQSQAKISVQRGATSDGNYFPTDIVFYNIQDNTGSYQERMRIKENGETKITGTLTTTSTMKIQNGSNIYFQVNSVTGTSMFIGINSGINTTGSTNSNFIGQSAGYNASNSSYSNFVGYNAGYGSISSISSIFIGESAGYNASNSSYSNFFGKLSGYNSSGSTDSNFIGKFSGQNSTGSTNSNFIGTYSGYYSLSSSYSNFIGYASGGEGTKSSYSNLFGYRVGNKYNSTTIGDNNIIIGTNISLPNNTSNGVNIGGILFGTGTYGDINTPSSLPTSNGKIGIGTSTPLLRLHVVDSSSSVVNISGFYNSYDYGLSNRGEARITMGKMSGTTTTDMGAIGAHPSIGDSNNNGVLSLYTRTNGSLTEKLTIDNNGNVGIGTTSPGLYKLNVQGTTYILSNLTVDGTTNLTNLNVSNTISFNSLSVSGTTTLNGGLTVNAISNLNNILNVNAISNLNSIVNISSNLNVTGITTLSSRLDVGGIMNVTNGTNLNSTLNVTGTTTLYSSLNVNGTSILNSLNVTNGTNLNSTLNVTGTTTLNNILNVNAVSNLNSDVNVTGYLNISDSSYLKSKLIIGGTQSSNNITYKSTTFNDGGSNSTAHNFVGGNNGGTTILTLNNNGMVTVPNQLSVGNVIYANYAQGSVTNHTTANGYIPGIKAFGWCDGSVTNSNTTDLKGGNCYNIISVKRQGGDYHVTMNCNLNSTYTVIANAYSNTWDGSEVNVNITSSSEFTLFTSNRFGSPTDPTKISFVVLDL